jgi:hypothetical protein
LLSLLRLYMEGAFSGTNQYLNLTVKDIGFLR